MSERVLSTAEAKASIATMQRIITGGLTDQIRSLNTEGTKLSEPMIWDGPLARDFRSTWPEVHRKLMAMSEELEQLRTRISRINQDIMQAGGASG